MTYSRKEEITDKSQVEHTIRIRDNKIGVELVLSLMNMVSALCENDQIIVWILPLKIKKYS